jgi:UDP-N-acetylmuramoyl-tripeptide--D-alanyl-D-alanine ligase
VIVAIAGRRAQTARILVDAAFGDSAHEFTDDFGAADIVVLFEPADVASVRDSAVVVAYADDAAVATSTDGIAASVVTFGLSSTADVRAGAVESTVDATAFTLHSGDSSAPVSVGILGESVVPLVLAALAVAAAAGKPTAESIAALAPVTDSAPHDMRVSHPADGVTLIDDSLDQSPRSTSDALKALAQFTIDGTRSVAVLGELDLPAGTDAIESRDEHDRIGRLVVRLNVSRLIVVGQSARHIHNAAGLEGSWDGESVLVDTLESAYDLLSDTELVPRGDSPAVVLVKAAGLTALINQQRRAT